MALKYASSKDLIHGILIKSGWELGFAQINNSNFEIVKSSQICIPKRIVWKGGVRGGGKGDAAGGIIPAVLPVLDVEAGLSVENF